MLTDDLLKLRYAEHQLVERAEPGQERVSDVEGAHAPDARAQLYRQQLGVRERRGTLVIEPLPGALLHRPLADLRRMVHTGAV